MTAARGNPNNEIDALFSPRSVVVFGASSDPLRVSGRPLSFLRDWEFPGELAVVNPRRDAVLGYPSYAEVAALPFVPDLAIVCVPAARVLDALEQCVERGVRAAVVFAAGFGEIADGCPDEPSIRELAARSGMAVCGPNCLGTISVEDRLPATFSTVLTEATLSSGDVAFVTQSGALGIYLYAEASRRGVGFSRWVSTGNETALGVNDYLEWLAQDERTRVICAYVEGVRDGDGFRRALAAAAEASKPVVVLKGGRSDGGARGVESHTGAIAGDATVFSGMLASAGAYEVDDASELLEVASIARLRPRLAAGRGAAIATTSGGGGILAADWLSRVGLRLATLSRSTVATIEPVIPAFGRAENPVDFTGNLMNDPDMVRVSAEALLRDEDVAAVVVFVGVGGETADRVVDALLAVAVPDEQVMAVVWIGASELVRQRLGAGGIPVFGDVGPCIRALSRLWQRSPRSESDPELALPATPKSGTLLLEHELKQVLAELGLPVPRGHSVAPTEVDDLVLEPERRYAVKGQASGVAHKAALGLVQLDCDSRDVSAAARTIGGEAARNSLNLERLLVEEMADPGVELLVTLRRDPTFGWVLLVGSGGGAVELLRDVVARPCPITESGAAAVLDSLAASELFEGLVAPDAARAAAGRLLVELSASSSHLPADVVELELNPIIVTPERAMIVDAVAFLEPRQSGTQSDSAEASAHRGG